MYSNDYVIVSVYLNDNGDLEVIKRYRSDTVLLTYPPKPAPDSIVKEIYKSIDGKIVLSQTIEGKHTPAYSVSEVIEF